ncbi:hypothetical protein IW150_007543, partial [Coemansia sp. RSA 2607]
MLKNASSQSSLAQKQPDKLLASSEQSMRSLHRAETVDKTQGGNQLPYNDTVPASQKEEVMDSVYCRVADNYDRAINIFSL